LSAAQNPPNGVGHEPALPPTGPPKFNGFGGLLFLRRFFDFRDFKP